MNDNTIEKKKQQINLLEILENPAKYKKIPIIKGIINEGEVMLVYGKSGVGKTFTSVDFALSVACHNPIWCNCEIINQRAKVLYFACESPEDIAERAVAWCRHYKKQSADFDYIEGAITFPILEAKLKEYTDKNLKLVFIDTISASTLCEDENNAKSVADFIADLHRIASENHLAFVIIHHSGKDDKKEDSYRGSSAFYGNVNSVLQLHQGKDFDEATGRNFSMMTFDKCRKKKPFKSVVFDIFNQLIDFDGTEEEIGVIQPRETQDAVEIRNSYNRHQKDLEQFIEIYREKKDKVLSWSEYSQKLVEKGYRKDNKDVLNKWRFLKDFFKANGIIGKDKVFKIVKGGTAETMLNEPPKKEQKKLEDVEKEIKEKRGSYAEQNTMQK